MIRIAHILREFFRNVSSNWITTVASLLSLTMLYVLFDLFWIGAGTSERFYSNLLADLRVDVFLEEGLTEDGAVLLGPQIETTDGVLLATYISREAARRELAELVGSDLLAGYDTTNPLPRSYELRIEPEYLTRAGLENMAATIDNLPGVENVVYSRDWIGTAEGTRAIVLQVGLALGLFVLATAVISSTNSIRLMTRTRAVGFRQKLLLGAGRLFVAMPFLIEGFFVSGLAATLGWLGIFYARDQFTITYFEIVYPEQDFVIIFCLAVAVLGAIGAYVGVRSQLKVRR